MGVITYFLLAGYTPFDRENQQQEMEAIIAGNYKFEPGASSELTMHPI
jgi:calcium/calmodulin-dependent protein kinase I